MYQPQEKEIIDMLKKYDGMIWKAIWTLTKVDQFELLSEARYFLINMLCTNGMEFIERHSYLYLDILKHLAKYITHDHQVHYNCNLTYNKYHKQGKDIIRSSIDSPVNPDDEMFQFSLPLKPYNEYEITWNMISQNFNETEIELLEECFKEAKCARSRKGHKMSTSNRVSSGFHTKEQLEHILELNQKAFGTQATRRDSKHKGYKLSKVMESTRYKLIKKTINILNKHGFIIRSIRNQHDVYKPQIEIIKGIKGVLEC